MKAYKLMTVVALCVFLSACGSDKEQAQQVEQSVKSPTTNTKYNPEDSTSSVASSFGEFKNKVKNGQFPSVKGCDEVYTYGRCELKEKELLGFIDYSTTECFESFSRDVTNKTVLSREDGRTSESEVKNYLKQLVNNASGEQGSYQQVNQSYWKFISGSKIYGINLALPAAANPVYEKDLNNSDNYAIQSIQSDYQWTGGQSCQF